MRFQNASWVILCLVSLLAGCVDTTGVKSVAEKTEDPASVDVAMDTDSSESSDVGSDEGSDDESVMEMPAEDEERSVPPLEIGDPAPPVAVAQWMTTELDGKFQPGKVYVVEFWATWCPPCRDSMPHLSSLQDKYAGDVVFMGITDEDSETVEKFLSKEAPGNDEMTWREVVNYALALDEKQETTTRYMRATNMNGIPTAYIVGREGHLLWYGHPMQMDGPLAKVVEGSWNRETASQQMESIVAARKQQERLQRAMMKGDIEGALEALDEIASDSDQAESFGVQLDLMRFKLLSLAERGDDAKALQQDLETKIWDEADALNDLSWFLATEAPAAAKDLTLASKLAERANELAEGNNASILDTLARVAYEQGDLDGAIKWQRDAVKLDPRLQESLDQYLIERAEEVQAEMQPVDGDSSDEVTDEAMDENPDVDSDQESDAGTSEETDEVEAS